MFDAKYWDAYYARHHTPWDMGHISPPIKAYIDQLEDKAIDILIPGAGNAYEAEYLWGNGFKSIDVVDIAAEPLKNLQQRLPLLPDNQCIQKDFFSLDKKYDLIIEQTFFCALKPDQRSAYAKKIWQSLKTAGKLIGLLFTFPLDTQQPDPPYGGSLPEYTTLFSDHFKIQIMETAYNSHPARQNREAFIILQKKALL